MKPGDKLVLTVTEGSQLTPYGAGAPTQSVATPSDFGAVGSGADESAQLQQFCDAACGLIPHNFTYFYVPTGRSYVTAKTLRLYNPKFPFVMDGNFAVPSGKRITCIQVADNGSGHEVQEDNENCTIILRVTKQKAQSFGLPDWDSYDYPDTWKSEDACRRAFLSEPDCGVEVVAAWNGTHVQVTQSEQFAVAMRCVSDQTKMNRPISASQFSLKGTRNNKVGFLLGVHSVDDMLPYANGNIIEYTSNVGFGSERPNKPQYAILLTAVWDGPDRPLWQPATAYSAGDRVRNKAGTGYLCVQAGTSGSKEPSSFSAAQPDGTVKWNAVYASAPNGNIFRGGMTEAWSRSMNVGDPTAVLVDRGSFNIFETYRVESYHTKALAYQFANQAELHQCRGNKLSFWSPNTTLTKSVHNGNDNVVDIFAGMDGRSVKVKESVSRLAAELRSQDIEPDGTLPGDWLATDLSSFLPSNKLAAPAVLTVDTLPLLDFGSSGWRQHVGVLFKVRGFEDWNRIVRNTDAAVRTVLWAFDSQGRLIVSAKRDDFADFFARTHSSFPYGGGGNIKFLYSPAPTATDSFSLRQGYNVDTLFIGVRGEGSSVKLSHVEIFSEGIELEAIKPAIVQKLFKANPA